MLKTNNYKCHKEKKKKDTKTCECSASRAGSNHHVYEQETEPQITCVSGVWI